MERSCKTWPNTNQEIDKHLQKSKKYIPKVEKSRQIHPKVEKIAKKLEKIPHKLPSGRFQLQPVLHGELAAHHEGHDIGAAFGHEVPRAVDLCQFILESEISIYSYGYASKPGTIGTLK